MYQVQVYAEKPKLLEIILNGQDRWTFHGLELAGFMREIAITRMYILEFLKCYTCSGKQTNLILKNLKMLNIKVEISLIYIKAGIYRQMQSYL